MAAADPRIKQIKIKTGVVKRLGKEKGYYEKEVIAQEAKIAKMKEDKADEYDVRKQEEVLTESQVMIPDCKKRLVQARGELQNLLDSEKDLAETEEYKTAQAELEATKATAEN